MRESEDRARPGHIRTASVSEPDPAAVAPAHWARSRRSGSRTRDMLRLNHDETRSAEHAAGETRRHFRNTDKRPENGYLTTSTRDRARIVGAGGAGACPALRRNGGYGCSVTCTRWFG